MKTIINGQEFQVTQNGTRFYYFSPLAGRKLPISKDKVIIK